MSEYTKLFERAGARYESPSLSTEGLLRRRDRKRRNQRITAGVVGIAVFLLAIWIVSGAGSLTRTQTPGAGPSVSEPTVSPTATATVAPDPYSVGFNGLPPEDATPSEPPRGELVMSDGGIHPWYEVNLYADGRLIWARGLVTNPGPTVSTWIEQRLTPEGVELLRSGTVPLGGQFENPGEQLPVSAWEDPELRPYVASRYAVCSWSSTPRLELQDKTRPIVSMVPALAQDLLRGAQPLEGGCLEVTTEDARSLAQILIDAGFEESGGGETGTVFFGDTKRDYVIAFDPILPDGGFVDGVGG